MLCLVLLVFLRAPDLHAQGAQVQARHARVELLSSRMDAVSAGDILLGVHFVLEKGWHIYWTNPGDSGQPPSFQWILPAGSTAGQIEWPRPERLQTSSAIVDYGYRDDVLLMVPLHFPAPQNTRLGEDIGVDAKWLICREVCLPDHAHLALSLPAVEPDGPGNARLFAKAKALLPRPWPKRWKAMVESRRDDFVLTVATGRPIRSAEFFPLDSGQIDNAAKQRLQPAATGAKLVLKKSDLLLQPISHLRGVLVIPARGAYQVRVQVLAQAAIK